MATLWLVGMMGAGKSAIGPRVADALGVAFVDLDQVIVLEAGLEVERIFREEGEAGFRAREAAALVGLVGSPVVVACGGGVVVDAENVAAMRRGGKVVWLDAPLDVLTARVAGGGGRPLLEGDPVKRLAEVAEERRDLYAAAAHRRVDCGDRAPEEIAAEVVRWWRSI